MTIDDIVALSRTQTVESGLVAGLWLSRSAVALHTPSGSMLPVFGFASDFDAELSRRKSIFELIEHLSFHPYKPILSDRTVVLRRSNGRWRNVVDCSPDSLQLGASNFGEVLHGNGCAVHTSLEQAASHAENEVLERHYCCEMWYNRRLRPRLLDIDVRLHQRFRNSVKFYEIGHLETRHLVISIVDADEIDFFCMGASLKPSREAAIHHCLGEAATLLDDVLLLRAGYTATAAARSKILSLRDRKLSQDRKQYFSSLLSVEGSYSSSFNSVSAIYAFRVLDDIFAARASTVGLLTPRRFHNDWNDVPIMPLF